MRLGISVKELTGEEVKTYIAYGSALAPASESRVPVQQVTRTWRMWSPWQMLTSYARRRRNLVRTLTPLARARPQCRHAADHVTRDGLIKFYISDQVLHI